MLKLVRVTSDSVTLQWSPPYSDGGSEIQRYVVLTGTAASATAAVGRWEEAGRVAGAATTTFTVQRLREGS